MDVQEVLTNIQAEIDDYKKSGGREDLACAQGLSIARRLIEIIDYNQRVEIPGYVADLVKWTVRNSAVPSDVITEFKIKNDVIPIEDINLPREELDLEKLSEYFQISFHRNDFERACFCRYLVV